MLAVQCNCIAVACCESRMATAGERQQLASKIIDNGWRDDSCLLHLTSLSLAKADNGMHRESLLSA